MPSRSDNYNRADTYPSGLGPSSGDATVWESITGDWGVWGNQARCSATADALTALECGAADGALQVGTYQLSDAGLAFRITDASNYGVVVSGPNQIALRVVIAGEYSSAIGEIYYRTKQDGEVVGVVLDGTSVSVLLDGVEVVAPQTIAHNATATKHGLWSYLDGLVRFDDWDFVPAGGDLLTAGTPGFVTAGPALIVVEASDATGGTGPYDYQWQRDDGSGYENLVDDTGGTIVGATTLVLEDNSVVSGQRYSYRLVYGDAASATVTSAALGVSAYPGGSLTGGGGSRFRSPLIRRAR